MRAINAYLLIAILTLGHGAPAAHAEGITVSMTVEPTPLHGQVHAYRNHTFQVFVANTGVTVAQGEPVEPGSSLQYTGRLIVVLSLQWNGKGGYDFGHSTTGYNYKLDSAELNTTITLPPNGTESIFSFNYTFQNDAYDYGMKPYENVEVTVKAAVYFEVYEAAEGPGNPIRGPEAGEASTVLKLLDEMKIDYVEGKLQEMAEELGPLSSFPRPGHVNVDAYLGLLEAMNASVREGDYFSALDTYKRYDEDRRADLISSLVREANTSSTRALQIQKLELQVSQLGTQINHLVTLHELELEQLQARYAALSQTYQLKQAELEEAKQSLTTAITAVFLASIAFFFIGRRSASGGILGLRMTPGG
jgi:hypothetical protein